MTRKASALLSVFLPSSEAQAKLDREGHHWWQHAAFYEIYPRSSTDCDNDGVRDLNGIALKLDCLRAKPWLPIPASCKIALRHNQSALAEGD